MQSEYANIVWPLEFWGQCKGTEYSYSKRPNYPTAENGKFPLYDNNPFHHYRVFCGYPKGRPYHDEPVSVPPAFRSTSSKGAITGKPYLPVMKIWRPMRTGWQKALSDSGYQFMAGCS